MKILSTRIENRYKLPKDDVPEFTNNQYFYDKEIEKVVYIEKGNGRVHNKK